MEDLISIVLPVYDGARYLSESIDSVIAQTYTNWELIIVDDCSKDDTAEIAKRYARKDSRIRYCRNEHNLRLPRNLNKGFSMASGQFLTWTSDDNVFLPDALKKMLAALKCTEGAEFVFCDYDIINENGEYISTLHIPENYKEQIVGNNIVGACFLYTRKVYDVIGDYQHGRLLVEDYDYWQRVFAKFPVVAIHEVMYKYRVHAASLTGKTESSITNRAYAETILCNSKLYKRLTIAQKYYLYYGLYRCSLSNGSKAFRGRYLFYKVLFYYPRRLRERFHGK